MNVTSYTGEISEFQKRVLPLLQVDEARNNLMLGISLSIQDYMKPEQPPPYLTCVEDGGEARDFELCHAGAGEDGLGLKRTLAILGAVETW